MKIDVYDSYARADNGGMIHFDVFVEQGTAKEKAFEYGRFWLTKVGENPDGLDQSRCNYCHSEQANPDIENSIQEKGFYILQMEGCPNPVI